MERPDPLCARLYERLRRSSSTSTVPGSLPVLFVGDLLSARVATVGLNRHSAFQRGVRVARRSQLGLPA